jgi:superfamily II DNA or RNA helicase
LSSPHGYGLESTSGWTIGGEVTKVVLERSEACLRSYQANVALIEEHANIETSVREGGYGHRQLYELIQNGADELRNTPKGVIHVVLTTDTLYCANLGNPITPEGVGTILASHLSRKRGAEIGRFGLGFKSVLSVSDQPQFFSRTGSFGWSAGRSASRIRERVQVEGPTPVLRVAEPLDPDAERESDHTLAELMGWAATVVKLPLLAKTGLADRLAMDLADFPAVFAVFSPHAGRVILEDRRAAARTRREIKVSSEQEDRRLLHVLNDGNEQAPEEWRVFETTFRPSEEAWADAGEYRNRIDVPIAWAVPVSGAQRLGRFWAFFPTTYETTLSGVLNAAWKTNEDRQHILEGNAFNRVLMEEAARLIVGSLPLLAKPEDPAWPLELMPARGRESRNWADGMLTDLVRERSASQPVLPDQDGRFQRPGDLKLHPRASGHDDKRWREWVERWASYPGRPVDWCHPSVERSTIRRSRADLVMEEARIKPRSVREWLEALVADGTAAASAVALSIVAEMVKEKYPAADDARQSAILRTSDGRMVAPQAASVFRRTPLDPPAEDTVYVDPDLEDLPGTSEHLETLGIREADALGRFAAAVSGGFAQFYPSDWERLWILARQAGAERAVEHLTERGIDTSQLRVRTRDGKYRPLPDCLLPGAVIPSGSPNDAQCAVDDDFHHDDMGMLRKLGMSDTPATSVDPSSASWFGKYRDAMVERYFRGLPATGRPQHGKVRVEGPSPAGPLGLVFDLTPAACARFIQNLPSRGLVTSWTVYATTRPDDVPLQIPSPLTWVIEQAGKLSTSMGIRRVSECVGPGLRAYERVLPVAEVDIEVARALGLAQSPERIKGSLWLSVLDDALTSRNRTELGMLYALAVTQLSAPAVIRCEQGDDWITSAPADVVVTTDDARHRRLLDGGFAVLRVPTAEDENILIDQWGMRAFDDVYVVEVRATVQGAQIPLEDVFPQLKFEPGRPLRGLSLARCDTLDQLFRTADGQSAEPITVAQQESTIFWLDRGGSELELLGEVNQLLRLGLSDERCREVIRHKEDVLKDRRLVEVRQLPELTDKLVAALGGDTLRERLPLGLVDAVEAEDGPVDDRGIAGLALAVYGSGVLREFRQELEDRGFPVPSQLAGSHGARAFVADLGFPADFAGFRQANLEPVLNVDGPVVFPSLHDYQEQIVQRILEVLQSRPALRGMVSLPTGAGKTRVAVEAVIRRLSSLSPEAESVPILWIAQSEELCEQAVQTWASMWRHTGPARPLTISRLWGANDADSVEEGCHLVVATDAKLEKVIDEPGYDWLRQAQGVIVDEAHTSISPRYTHVFAALGLTPHRTRCPLIGLTATPFRAKNTEESDRLVARYGRNRLDHHRDGAEILGAEPYATLQKLGVLAQVRHEELPGVLLDLNPREREELERMRRLPSSAEERLGHDTSRNRILIEKILELPADWPVLLFATSVNHAHTMAALLTRKGISAAAVSGDTDLGQRRHAIEQFRKGRIRVLTNYNVLSQGFDAPATRAVIVARPTYSPNVYQQMIGRGLRGPLNGGKEECLIVNVADNIAQYGEQLAFRQFEYLWSDR